MTSLPIQTAQLRAIQKCDHFQHFQNLLQPIQWPCNIMGCMPVKLEDQDRDPSRKYQDLLLWLMYVLFHSFSPYLIPYLRTFAPLEKWPTFTGLLVSTFWRRLAIRSAQQATVVPVRRRWSTSSTAVVSRFFFVISWPSPLGIMLKNHPNGFFPYNKLNKPQLGMVEVSRLTSIWRSSVYDRPIGSSPQKDIEMQNPTWLVVLPVLKNMSSSMGRII